MRGLVSGRRGVCKTQVSTLSVRQCKPCKYKLIQKKIWCKTTQKFLMGRVRRDKVYKFISTTVYLKNNLGL